MHWEIWLNLGAKKIARSGHKSENISESVNSFHPGAIFLPPLGQKRSRGAFVGSIQSLEQISLGGTVFGHDPKMSNFLGFSDWLHENWSNFNFSGPAGGSALERASPPRAIVIHDS